MKPGISIAVISLGLLTVVFTSTALAQSYVPQASFGTMGSGNGQFQAPTGVAIDPTTHNIVVGDETGDRLQIFDSAGAFLIHFGSAGRGNGQFDAPGGLAIDPTTHDIVVADINNDRVQIFDSTGNYLSQFGSIGSGKGQFRFPNGVAIDPTTHNIVVADASNDRVEIFDSTGVFLSEFGSSGTDNGQFNSPGGVAIDPTTHNIVVADTSNARVQIFDSSGNYLSQFGSPGSAPGQFGHPVFVAIDPSTGNIIVTDAIRNNMAIFDSTGVYQTQFLLGSAAGVAIDPTTLNIIVVDGVKVDIFVPTSSQPTAVAVEYYYAPWNFYFVTAFPAEIAALDAGALGGWERTGTFNVWSQPNAMSSPTCRFFSTPTAFGGKSSHFYTPFPAECQDLQTNPALSSVWRLETPAAFYVALTDASGNCSVPGTVPLYRAYNNGMGGAPNHRYTTNPAVQASMISQGWVAEGNGPDVIFACVPL